MSDRLIRWAYIYDSGNHSGLHLTKEIAMEAHTKAPGRIVKLVEEAMRPQERNKEFIIAHLNGQQIWYQVKSDPQLRWSKFPSEGDVEWFVRDNYNFSFTGEDSSSFSMREAQRIVDELEEKRTAGDFEDNAEIKGLSKDLPRKYAIGDDPLRGLAGHPIEIRYKHKRGIWRVFMPGTGYTVDADELPLALELIGKQIMDDFGLSEASNTDLALAE